MKGPKIKAEAELAALEARVHLGELRAREIEAEVRLAKAMAKRQELAKSRRDKLHRRKKARKAREAEKSTPGGESEQT